MEHLLQDGISASNITKLYYWHQVHSLVYGLDTAAFRDRRIPLFLKAVKITRPLKPVLLDVHLLENNLQICQILQHPSVSQALYTFYFFTFLRISNILPHTMASFDPSRQLCRADVVFVHSKVVVIIKLSKTIQDRCKTTSITILVFGASPLCPVAALTAMFNRFPAVNDSPLFQVPSHVGLDRKHLKNISIALSLNKSLTFHDFGRAGASWAFQHRVPLKDIQAQGTWSSQCVWRYVHLPTAGGSTVAATFRAHLAS